jgi:phosphatidylglycerophosphate synthase
MIDRLTDRLDGHIAVEVGRGSVVRIWSVLMISRSLFVLYFELGNEIEQCTSSHLRYYHTWMSIIEIRESFSLAP